MNSDTSQMTSTKAIALPAPDPAITLWLCPLDCSSDESRALERTLSPAEIERADRFGTPALRARWIAGRAALRRLLGAALGVDPTAVPLRRGTRGRPEIAGGCARFQCVAHRQRGADRHRRRIAARRTHRSRHRREDRAVNADGLARKFMTTRERAAMAPLDEEARRRHFLRLWTCKEAMSKATGDALRHLFGTST